MPKSHLYLPIALLPLIGGCTTMPLLHRAIPPTPEPPPLVISPACLAPPVEAQPVETPPMPDPIERPAGEPNAANFTLWLSYIDRRRERAELAGLFFQGERDSEKAANDMNAEQLRQCNAWAQANTGEHH